MLEMMRQMMHQMESLRAMREADREDVATQIRALQSAVATQTPTPQPSSQPLPRVEVNDDTNQSCSDLTRRKPLPNPEPFNGKRADYPMWQGKMKMKLRLDWDLLRSDQERFYLVNSCLGEKAERTVQTFFLNGEAVQWNPWRFIEYLDRCYLDRNQQERAAENLRGLRQKEGQPFGSFVVRFEQELARAGGMAWDSSAQIAFLRGAISQRLRDALIPVRLPSDYHQWVQEVSEVAWKLENSDRVANLHRKSSDRPENLYRRNRPMPPPSKNQDSDGDTPMTGINRTGIQQRRSRDDEAKQQPFQGKCWVCGKRGHQAFQCRDRKGGRAQKEDPSSKVPKVARVSPRDSSSDEEGSQGSSDSEKD